MKVYRADGASQLVYEGSRRLSFVEPLRGGGALIGARKGQLTFVSATGERSALLTRVKGTRALTSPDGSTAVIQGVKGEQVTWLDLLNNRSPKELKAPGVIRQLAPLVPIVSRSRYHRFRHEIEAAGATEVVDEEHEVGRSLLERSQRRLQGGK